MYIHVNSLQYLDGKWGYTDILTKTITELVTETRFNLITVEDTFGKYYLLDNNTLDNVVNKEQSLGQYLLNNGPILTQLKQPVELEASRYMDTEDITRIGIDYMVGDNTPMLFTSTGIRPIVNGQIKSVHPATVATGDFVTGKLEVGLPWIKHTFLPSEFTASIFKFKKKFKLNNTLLIFGDSLIKANRLFKDDGDGYRLRSGSDKWLVDLYIDNLTKLPPTTLGKDANYLLKEVLVSKDTLAKVFSHNNVFFIEYQYDYPIGDERIDIINEYVDDYYDGLIMYNNKPTCNKVLHLQNRYMVRKMLMLTNLQTFNDNENITLAAEDRVITLHDGYIYNLDYPIVLPIL